MKLLTCDRFGKTVVVFYLVCLSERSGTPKDARAIRLQRDFTVGELIDMAMEARPELKSAESARRAAEAEIGVAKSAFLSCSLLYD